MRQSNSRSCIFSIYICATYSAWSLINLEISLTTHNAKQMKVVAEDLPTLEFAQDRLSKQIKWLETKPDNVRQSDSNHR